jgi:flagellar biogenesis protein FliO
VLLVRPLLALLAVTAVLAGLYVALRALSHGGRLRSRRLLRVVETLPLAHGTALHVVRIAERDFVVGASPGGIALICEIPANQMPRE